MTRRGLFATFAAVLAAPKLAPAVQVLQKTYTPVRYSVGFTVSRKAMEEELARLRFIAESVEGVPLYLTDPDDWYLTPPAPTDAP